MVCLLHAVSTCLLSPLAEFTSLLTREVGLLPFFFFFALPFPSPFSLMSISLFSHVGVPGAPSDTAASLLSNLTLSSQSFVCNFALFPSLRSASLHPLSSSVHCSSAPGVVLVDQLLRLGGFQLLTVYRILCCWRPFPPGDAKDIRCVTVPTRFPPELFSDSHAAAGAWQA